MTRFISRLKIINNIIIYQMAICIWVAIAFSIIFEINDKFATSSVSLLPIPLALKCRTLNVLSSLIYSADGAGVGDSEGGGRFDGWVFEAEQGSQVQSLFLRYCAAFKSPEHFACTHPEHLVHR